MPIKSGQHCSLSTEFKKGQHPSIATEFKKGQIGNRLGSKHSEETKKKMGSKLKGKVAWNKGQTFPGYHNNKTKVRIGKAAKERWQNPEYREKTIRAIVTGSHIKPNLSELKLYSILQKCLPNEFALNVLGDKMILGGKIPDFVNINGKKQLVELYGEFWHSPEMERETPEERINYFRKFGFNTLIIWEAEMKNEGMLKTKILNFGDASMGGIE